MSQQIEPSVRNRSALPAALQGKYPNLATGDGEPDLVSVIVPVYNRAHLLERALESIARQTWPTIEAIVVDDGSSEDIAGAVRAFPFTRYVRQDNQGVTAARNRGLREARGAFIAFLDSDDWWDDWKVAAQLAILRRHPEVIMVSTEMRAVDATGACVAERYLRDFYSGYHHLDLESVFPVVGTLGDLSGTAPAPPSSPYRVGDLFSAMLFGNMVHTSTALFRRTRLVRGGGFDPALARAGEDYEFHWRTSWFGPVALLEEPAISYRIGAADQLTGLAWSYERAHNALITVSHWLAAVPDELAVPRRVIDRRLAELCRWCGEWLLHLKRPGALPFLTRSLRLEPTHGRAWLLAGLATLPSGAQQAVLRAWHGRPWRRR